MNESSPDAVRHEMLTLALDEGRRTLTDQSEVLGAARSRAGLIVSGSTVAASFLASAVFDKLGDGADHAAIKVALGCYLVSVVVAVAVLVPIWRMTFAVRPALIMEHYASMGDDSPVNDRLAELAGHYDSAYEDNKCQLAWMHALVTVSAAVMTAGVACWAWLLMYATP